MIELVDLLPAAEQGWQLLMELAEDNDSDWLLIGGQMVFLLAVEYGERLPRPTADMDVVVNVRARPGGTRWLANWLGDRGFTQDTPSADGLSYRFIRSAGEGLGNVIFDILAPEGLGDSTDLTTIPPGRTVQTPGATQGFDRSALVDVGVRRADGELIVGRVRRPDLVGALVLKAAAVSEIAVRISPDRDWQDCALLLAIVEDPIGMAESMRRRDRSRLRRLVPLNDRSHVGWATLTDDHYRRGIATLSFLTG